MMCLLKNTAFLLFVALFPAMLLAAEAPVGPSECIIGKDCFAVIQPYLIERACYLYFHERIRVPEAHGVVTRPAIELNPDQLHVEFLKLLEDKKLMSLKKGTAVSGCQYDLPTITGGDTITVTRPNLPEFNCGGFLSRFVAVRPLNSAICYWVAVEDILCK
jgi:hypothetical protein